MPPTPTTPSTPPRRTRAYTTTSGERVTKFSDGTEKRVSATPNTPAPVTTPTTDIPVTAIDGGAPKLTIPEVPQISDAAGPAKTAAGQFLEQAQNQANARLQETEAKGTASENKVRELMGLVNTESATRTKLEEARGVTGIEEQMRQAEESIASQIAEIDAFDLSNVTDLEQMRIDGSKRDITKRTYGAQAAEFNLQRTVERAGMAAGLRATVAGNLALQGNLDAATEQVDKALKAIYDPIRQGLEMEKFFLQRNDVRLGEDRAEARELRMKGIDRQFAEIDRAQSLVDSAVASGYAGSEDIKQMTALSGNPEAQSAFALQIVAKGRRAAIAAEAQTRALQQAKLRAELDAATKTEEEGSYQIKTAKNEEMMRHLGIIKSSGNVVKNLSTGGLFSRIGDALKGAAAGAGLLGGAGTLAAGPVGTAIGGTTGFLGGFGGTMFSQHKAQEELLASTDYLLNSSAFQSIRDEKQAGVTFGQLSNEERQAAARAANALIASVRVEEGISTGFRGSPESVMENVRIFEEAVRTNQDRLNAQMLSDQASAEIARIYAE